MEHGKASTYTNHKCRCPACKAAWARYHYDRQRHHRQKRQLTGLCIECTRPATRGLRCATHAKVASQNSTIRHLRRKLDELRHEF